MKKILSLLLCMLFGLSLFLTGCGTGLSDVQNNEVGIIYNGGGVAFVGDHLFFANAFASGHADMADMNAYNDAAKYANLNRVDMNKIGDATKYASSENVETVSQGDYVGHSETYMFAYKNCLYYVCPTTHKTSENKNVFDVLSVFRINYNGSGRAEVYTTKASFNATEGKIVAVEYNNIAYLMIFDGENFTTIDITNGGAKVELEDVNSVALPQENAEWNGVVYYTKSNEEATLNDVFKINVDGTNQAQINNKGEISKTVKFIGRYDDKVFYSISDEGSTSVKDFVVDAEDIVSGLFSEVNSYFYTKEISNIMKVNVGTGYPNYKGYIFNSSGNVLYKNVASNEEATVIIKSNDYASAKVICAIGPYVYFSTASGIYKVSVVTKEVETIVSSDEIKVTTDIAGYTVNTLDGEVVEVKDIFFFAERMYDAEESGDKSDKKVYMYKVSAKGGDATVVSKFLEEETKEEA